MKITKEYILSEINDLKCILILLCKGKGSLSDYFLMVLTCCSGLAMGYLMWGV